MTKVWGTLLFYISVLITKAKFEYNDRDTADNYEIENMLCPDLKPCYTPLIYNVRYRCLIDGVCPEGYKCCRSDCYVHKVCVVPVNDKGEEISPPPFTTSTLPATLITATTEIQFTEVPVTSTQSPTTILEIITESPSTEARVTSTPSLTTTLVTTTVTVTIGEFTKAQTSKTSSLISSTATPVYTTKVMVEGSGSGDGFIDLEDGDDEKSSGSGDDSNGAMSTAKHYSFANIATQSPTTLLVTTEEFSKTQSSKTFSPLSSTATQIYTTKVMIESSGSGDGFIDLEDGDDEESSSSGHDSNDAKSATVHYSSSNTEEPSLTIDSEGSKTATCSSTQISEREHHTSSGVTHFENIGVRHTESTTRHVSELPTIMTTSKTVPLTKDQEISTKTTIRPSTSIPEFGSGDYDDNDDDDLNFDASGEDPKRTTLSFKRTKPTASPSKSTSTNTFKETTMKVSSEITPEETESVIVTINQTETSTTTLLGNTIRPTLAFSKLTTNENSINPEDLTSPGVLPLSGSGDGNFEENDDDRDTEDLEEFYTKLQKTTTVITTKLSTEFDTTNEDYSKQQNGDNGREIKTENAILLTTANLKLITTPKVTNPVYATTEWLTRLTEDDDDKTGDDLDIDGSGETYESETLKSDTVLFSETNESTVRSSLSPITSTIVDMHGPSTNFIKQTTATEKSYIPIESSGYGSNGDDFDPDNPDDKDEESKLYQTTSSINFENIVTDSSSSQNVITSKQSGELTYDDDDGDFLEEQGSGADMQYNIKHTTTKSSSYATTLVTSIIKAEATGNKKEVVFIPQKTTSSFLKTEDWPKSDVGPTAGNYINIDENGSDKQSKTEKYAESVSGNNTTKIIYTTESTTFSIYKEGMVTIDLAETTMRSDNTQNRYPDIETDNTTRRDLNPLNNKESSNIINVNGFNKEGNSRNVSFTAEGTIKSIKETDNELRATTDLNTTRSSSFEKQIVTAPSFKNPDKGVLFITSNSADLEANSYKKVLDSLQEGSGNDYEDGYDEDEDNRDNIIVN